MIAEIIINSTARDLNKTFDYIIPNNMKVKIGTRVLVQFKTRNSTGYVIGLKETSEFATKEILEVYDNYLDESKIKLAELMAKRYFCNISDCVKLMLPPGNVKKGTKERVKNWGVDEDKVLTDEQKIAFDTINKYIQNSENDEFLLYGVTGSGKTEVYLQLIKRVLEKDKCAIVLVPEISLTPQMVDRFISRFGKEQIAIIHSKLSKGERCENWQKIYNGEARIIIGARSAIFAPVKDLGIIIIDEEHDSSYKSEGAPRYNAKDLARYICKKAKVPLVLGSATPDVSTYYRTKNVLRLTKRANSSSLPDVEIVDMRDELALGNKSGISARLKEEISRNLEKHRQTILFLNRRGFATCVVCTECGLAITCPRCNITLTHHLKENKLKCHYCGYEREPVSVCPKCSGKTMNYSGVGTQRLETEIQKMFPNASTIRMDVDSVSKKNSHEDILEKFKNDNIDILIGTQMVVKGHHFPNVTLVGVISADSSLNIDDFRAGERTFQLLTQVAGRAGRENLPGKVIIQTFNPDSYSIEYSKQQDYDLFYNTEIKFRKQLQYPPFCDIILFNLSSTDEGQVEEVAKYIYNRLVKSGLNMLLFKPLPAPIKKINNKFRWRMILKCKADNNIVNTINQILKDYYGLKFKKTSVSVDINPMNMM